MIDTEPAEPEAGPHPYFLAIEDVFLELRGSPLQLSPKDWQIAKGWHDAGVPLELVERVVREVFERRQARQDSGKVWSLRHCKRAVDKAWQRQQELTPGKAEATEALDLANRLVRLADALPGSLQDREQFSEKIRSLRGDAESIEHQLAQIDREVVAVAEGAFRVVERQAIADELAQAREALAERLPRDELDRAADRLREEISRRHTGLPVLSLFAPEALEPEV